MIKRMAIVAHPPLLVPDLVTGAVADTAELREAAVEAASWLAADCGTWRAVGTSDGLGGPGAEFGPSVAGSFEGFGADVGVSLSTGAADFMPDLPLPALIAGWLREQAGASAVQVDLLPADLPPAGCMAFGRELDASASALLVLGDGSNRHGEQAPARPDARAAGFDADVAKALATADGGALAAIDPELSAELGVTGRVPWQVAAGVLGDARWTAKLRYSSAPFGVGYHVATLERW